MPNSVGLHCPFCGGHNVTVDTVDIGVGEIQSGPATCDDCHAAQGFDGEWRTRAQWEASDNCRSDAAPGDNSAGGNRG